MLAVGWHLFIARFFLGIGIGPKSATVPIYAAEVREGSDFVITCTHNEPQCSPALIRGALV